MKAIQLAYRTCRLIGQECCRLLVTIGAHRLQHPERTAGIQAMSNIVAAFRLHEASVCLRHDSERVPEGCAALAMTGGSRDFKRRRAKWQWWWSHESANIDDVMTRIHSKSWVPCRSSPFLGGAPYWLVPQMMWPLLGQGGRLYVVMTCSADWATRLRIRTAIPQVPGVLTFCVKCSSKSAATRARWQDVFFQIDTCSIALGFTGAATELEACLLSSPDMASPMDWRTGNRFRHLALQGIERGGADWLLEQASVVLLPYGGENHDGLLMTARLTEDEVLSRICDSPSGRLDVVECGGDGGFREWVRSGRLPSDVSEQLSR